MTDTTETLEPESHPFGETKYKHYDPEQVNTVDDAVELFRWLKDENRKKGNKVAAAVFEECANTLETEIQE